jgi:hypothetical protein
MLFIVIEMAYPGDANLRKIRAIVLTSCEETVKYPE